MKIALINVTLNALLPMRELLLEQNHLEVKYYLDDGLQAIVQQAGQVTDESLARLSNLVGNSIRDGAELVVLTCTVFTPYIKALRLLFSVPIIGADAIMLEQAAALGKKTAILCTFPATIATSSLIFRNAVKDLGVNAAAETFLLEDAAKAIASNNKDLHDQIIAREAERLSKEFEVIVLAQISMCGAVKLMRCGDVPVFTSPESVLKKILSL